MTDQRTDDDCLVCCLSWVLGLPYEEVPHFVRDFGGMWMEELREWLDDRGLEIVSMDNHWPRKGVYLADGWTDRETSHMTVWRGVEMVFDPHPSRAGLTNVRRTYWLMPLDLRGEAPAGPARGWAGGAVQDRDDPTGAHRQRERRSRFG